MAEHDMEMESHVERRNRANSGRADGAALFAFTVLGFLVGWVVVEYLHNVYLQQYLSGIIHSSGSVLRLFLPLGVLSLAVSILLHRRKSRKLQSTLEGGVSLPPSVSQPTVAHPLFLFERPSRDSKFVVRRTKAPGRISRMRDAERLPSGELN